MTNKHRKGSGTRKAETAKKAEDRPLRLAEPSFFNYTRAQFASLIFFSIGCAKLVELSTATRESFENPSKCLQYLGEANAETCMHPSFSSLILAKYYSGLSLAGYLLSGMMILWKSEFYFLKFMTLMAMSPLVTTIVATFASQPFLERGRMWHILILASALYSTIAPQSSQILPFMSDQNFTPKTPQTKILMGLTVVAAWELFRVVFNSHSDLANSLLDTYSPLPMAATTAVNFWMVDKSAMLLLPIFIMLHLPVNLQRSFLFFTAIIKGAEFGIQMSRMEEPYINGSLVEAATLGSAVASAYGWFA